MEVFTDFYVDDNSEYPLYSDSISPAINTNFSVDADHYQQYFEGKNKYYYCAFPGCGKTFKYRCEISGHLLAHSSCRSFKCPIDWCQRSFKRDDALQKHLQIHRRGKVLECNIPQCNLRFFTKRDLGKHLLDHKDDGDVNVDNPYLISLDLKDPFDMKKTQKRSLEDKDHLKFFEPPMQKSRLATKLSWETKTTEDSDPIDNKHNKIYEVTLERFKEENEALKQRLNALMRTFDDLLDKVQPKNDEVLKADFQKPAMLGYQPKPESEENLFCSFLQDEDFRFPNIDEEDFKFLDL